MKLRELFVVQMLTGRWTPTWDNYDTNRPGRVVDTCLAWAGVGYQLSEGSRWWGLLLWPLGGVWAVVWVLALCPVWLPCVVLSVGLDVWRGKL